MITGQDLPMDGQCATAVFAAKGTDVTPNKDQGVIKVSSSLFHSSMSFTYCFTRCLCSSALFVQKVCLLNSTHQSLPSTGCEVPRAGWRPANDWGQSDYPLHRETAEWKEV